MNNNSGIYGVNAVSFMFDIYKVGNTVLTFVPRVK